MLVLFLFVQFYFKIGLCSFCLTSLTRFYKVYYVEFIQITIGNLSKLNIVVLIKFLVCYLNSILLNLNLAISCIFLAMLECIHAHHNFLYCKVFIVHLCDLVDVPEFYEEACVCPDCVPSCCQGKWHMNYLLFFTMHLSDYFIFNAC